MNITLIEPFFTGSHAAWATGYARHSAHALDILSLSGNYWKWRMHGGAVTLAQKFLASGARPDVLLATDMLDLTTFLALTRHRTARLPTAIYFHENQICYPWSPEDRDILNKRDRHYGFINYSSALAADLVAFNSEYHRRSFLAELPRFLKHFPDHQELETVAAIAAKSCVLPLGLDLRKFDAPELRPPDAGAPDRAPLVLWNHRWEYDKNPDEFFQALFALDEQGLDFRVALLGDSFRQTYPAFAAARERLGSKIAQYGYVEDVACYAQWLRRADILPVTSRQDFFGAGVAEAVYCGCYPLLPRRLNYPDLIPAERYPDLFYADFQELVHKLGQAVRKIDVIRTQNFRAWIEPHAWPRMAAEYDRALTALAERCAGA